MRSICFILSLACLAACGPASIEQLCEDASVTQCATCYSCEIDGADACDLASGTDVDMCVSELTSRCAGQAATLERPKRAIKECTDTLDQVTCDMLVRSAVQDAPHTTDACVYFL